MSYGYGPQRNYGGDGFRLSQRLIPIVIGLIAIGITMARGCQHGPFGRTQVVAISPDQESQLGLQAYREVLSTSHIVRQGRDVEAVHRVTQRLIRATQSQEFQRRIGTRLPKFEWHVEVVDDPQVNAFCLPGGKIVVYTGILPVTRNDAGLATVIGHEISHALAHHSAERMAQQQMANIGLTAAGASIGDMDPEKHRQVMMVLNAGSQFGILKYSRNHETEADHMGLLLMAAAGYDPEQSIDFWKRMSATSTGDSKPAFLQTHPSHTTRIHDLQQWMPEAKEIYERSAPDIRGRVKPEAETSPPPRPRR